jgi:voltage-gated potassium channel Kch
MSEVSSNAHTLRWRVLTWTRRHEGILFSILGCSVMALTFWGYYVHPNARPSTTLPEALYVSIKSIAGGVPWGNYGWQGNLANYLDLVLIMGVAGKATLLAFANRADMMRSGWRRGHTVICGLGERGKALCESLLRVGESVTVVEVDGSNPNVSLARAQGACVVIGDATESDTMHAVRVDRAHRVIATLPNDDQSAAVAEAVSHAASGDVPRCFVHNAHPSAWTSIFSSTDETVIPFSVLDSSCTDVFLTCDLDADSEPASITVVGTGAIAESIVMRASRVWQAIALRNGHPAEASITVIGPDARIFVSETLPMRYPGIEKLCHLVPREVDSYEVVERVAACSLVDGCNPVGTIVATEDPESTIHVALALAQCLPDSARIVTVMRGRSGLLDLLTSKDPALAARLEMVDVNHALDDPGTLLGGRREELARLAHEDWLRTQPDVAGDSRSSGPIQHWEALSDSFKASNRDQMSAVFEKMLPRLRCAVVPLAEWSAVPFEFRDDEIEALARIEHERWCEERERAGWVLDRTLAERDAARKLSPWLVPFDELPEIQKDNDRRAIDRIPVLFARAGFRLRRDDEV